MTWDIDKILTTAGKVIAYLGWVVALIVALRGGQPVPQPPVIQFDVQPGATVVSHPAK